MPDQILLLPDNIANQIAAGEVIQRPASAVKELLENAVDAGATSIRLFVNDAGKSMIQVVDNGKGMSATDARMSFERHATSKIRNIDDLFHIRTMGFRGEALASIAAVAQVELKTRRMEDEAGTYIEIENSLVAKQEPIASQQGTSISMKNLFFNVPARRNFLKSNAAEMRHIIDEFTRVSLAFPEIFFSLTSNGQQVFHLEAGSLKQRIIQLLGNSYSTKLVTVKEETDYLNISGFVGKPETAKKTRGDQYFFVNNRFIRSPYLNHAVMSAFQDLISPDNYAMYVLFIDLDPTQIDVNVHPTKQEIKFEDEKIVYAFVQAAIKHALAQFSITPTLDFELDASIQQLSSVQQPFTSDRQLSAAGSSLFKTFTQKHQAHIIETSTPGFQSWQEIEKPVIETGYDEQSFLLKPHIQINLDEIRPVQLLHTYMLVSANDSFLLFHQQFVHERVIYERLQQAMNGKNIAVQRSIFPATVQLSAADTALLEELLPDLNKLGYLIEPFGNNTYVVQGTPADVESGDEKRLIDSMLEQFKHFSAVSLSLREKLVRSVVTQQSVKTGMSLNEKEMKSLLADLFACTNPNVSPAGNSTYVEFKKDQLDKMFARF